MWLNSERKYGYVSIAIHWITALLIISAYLSIHLAELFEHSAHDFPLEAFLKEVHYVVGLSIFLLLLGRLALLVIQTRPVHQSVKPQNDSLLVLTTIVHNLLYLFLFSMPILGWLTLSAEGETFSYIGFTMPSVWERSEFWEDLFEETHEIIGTFGYLLIGLHSSAALVHHYVFKDQTVSKMLP